MRASLPEATNRELFAQAFELALVGNLTESPYPVVAVAGLEPA